MQKYFFATIVGLVLASLCLIAASMLVNYSGKSTHANRGGHVVNAEKMRSTDAPSQLARATFGGGCFWCTEAVFQQFSGVSTVQSGYAGGAIPDPSYQEVCSGITGHAEVVQITYDPKVVTYNQLLEAFWQSHDPTTFNRQGNDLGTQYRSIILYHNEDQKRLATESIERLEEENVFGAPIVTEIAPLETFYPADTSHQNFYRSNKNLRYCTAIIQPKVEKIRKVFSKQVLPSGD